MNPEQLRHAREFLGLTQSQLAELAEVKQATIARMESGNLSPSEELVARIAEITKFPSEFFKLATDFNMPLGSLVYRRHSKLKSPDRIKSYRMARQAYMLYRHLAKRLTRIPLRIPRKLEEDPITAAQVVRSSLSCDPEAPVKSLLNRLERAGIIVLMLPEEFDDLDGFSTWIDGRHPSIFLSANKPGDRQRLTAGHELGHLVLHFNSDLEELEREAYQFAQELLMPRAAARRELSPPLTLSRLIDVKKRWGLSVQALIERAYHLGIISLNQRKYLRIQISKRRWNKSEPQPIQAEKPRALRQMAEILYGENIDFRRFSKEVHLSDFILKQFLDPYAMRRPQNARKATSGKRLDFPLQAHPKAVQSKATR